MGWVRALCVLRGFGVWFVVFLFGRLVRLLGGGLAASFMP